MDEQTKPRRPRSKPALPSFDDGEAMLQLVTNSFVQAAREAVAENDRLGIVTHGTDASGKLVERNPIALEKNASRLVKLR